MNPIIKNLLLRKHVAVFDSFDRPDSASSLGLADTGQSWQSLNGTWGISSNKCYSLVDAGNGLIVIDSGLSECTMNVLMATVDRYMGLLFRVTDINNFLQIIVQAVPGGMRYEFLKKAAGSFTSLGVAAVDGVTGDVIQIKLSGSSIKVNVNSIERFSVTESFNQTATKYGFFSGSINQRWDNFSVEAI